MQIPAVNGLKNEGLTETLGCLLDSWYTMESGACHLDGSHGRQVIERLSGHDRVPKDTLQVI